MVKQVGKTSYVLNIVIFMIQKRQSFPFSAVSSVMRILIVFLKFSFFIVNFIIFTRDGTTPPEYAPSHWGGVVWCDSLITLFLWGRGQLCEVT